jgi:hypothetical protein
MVRGGKKKTSSYRRGPTRAFLLKHLCCTSNPSSTSKPYTVFIIDKRAAPDVEPLQDNLVLAHDQLAGMIDALS